MQRQDNQGPTRGEARRGDGDATAAAERRDTAGGSFWWRSNRGVAILLLIVVAGLGIYIWQSDWAHRVMRDGFRLGGFPMIGVALMAIFISVLIFDNRRNLVEPELASLTFFMVVVAVGVLVILYMTFQAFWLIGFAPSVAIFVTVCAVSLGYRPVWIAVATGIGAALVLRGIGHALAVPLPDGSLVRMVTGAL